MVRLSRPRLIPGSLSLPIGGGVLAALAVAGAIVVLPDWRLEQLVDATGLPRVFSLAAPPLGHTARLLLALVAGAVAGAIAWSTLFLLFGPGGPFHRERQAGDRPVVRRADRHPDAPPRHPLTAAELGTPPPAERAAAKPAERDIPADLDQPLAAFDPAAIPEVPLPAERVMAPPPPVRLVEPMPAPAPAPAAAPPVPAPAPAPAPLPRNDAPPPSIAALLDRLERETRHRRA